MSKLKIFNNFSVVFLFIFFLFCYHNPKFNSNSENDNGGIFGWILLDSVYKYPFYIPLIKNISIDGYRTEWTSDSQYFSDPSEDSWGGGGTDIGGIYIAHDDINFYYFIDLNGVPDTTSFVEITLPVLPEGSGFIMVEGDGTVISSQWKAYPTIQEICNSDNGGNLEAGISSSGVEVRVNMNDCLTINPNSSRSGEFTRGRITIRTNNALCTGPAVGSGPDIYICDNASRESWFFK